MTGERRETVRERWDRLVEPRSSGLPNAWVTWWFPVALLVSGVVLVAARLSGTSRGILWLILGEGADPRLLAGTPRLIRSDEWLVNQGWTISQARWGYPTINPTFPGGMDATVLQELPSWDWSTILRPHEWGYLLFGLDVGISWMWWLPGLALAAAAYLAIVVFLPRRPLSAAALALGVVTAPVLTWNWGPNALWPAAWSLLFVAGVRWMLSDERRAPRWVWAAVLGWLATTTAIGLYVPYIVPCVVTAVVVVIGLVVDAARGDDRLAPRVIVARLVPLVVAGSAAAAVLTAWVLTRIETIRAVSSTVYPGARTVPSGDMLRDDPFLLGTASFVMGPSFSDDTLGTVLGSSASTAASGSLLPLFLLIGLVVLVVRSVRAGHRLDAVSVALTVVVVLAVAYLLIPGIDLLGTVTLFDKVTPLRFRVILVVLLPLVFALVVRHVDSAPRRIADWPAIVAAALVVASTGWVVAALAIKNPEVLQAGLLWIVVALASLVAAWFVFVRGRAPIAAVSIGLASLVAGGGANPVYVGTFDLGETETGRAIREVDAEAPGAWVGVGAFPVMAVLVEAGVVGYSGLQTEPSEEMWEAIDPPGEYEDIWNRLAQVRWQFGEGEPEVMLFQQDLVVTTFDACSAFGQDHVGYVLSDSEAQDPGCLRELDDIVQGTQHFYIYEVVPG